MATVGSFSDNERVNRLRYEASTDGVAEATASLEKLSSVNEKLAETSATMETAQAKTTAAVGASVTVNERQSATTLRAGQSLDRLVKSIDDQYRAESRIAAGRSILDNSLRQGLITESEHAARLDQLIEKYGAVTEGVTRHSQALGMNRIQAQEASHVIRATSEMILAGMSPLQALALEHSRIITFFQMGEGSVANQLAGFGRAVYGMLGPIGTAVAGVSLLASGIAWFSMSTKDSTKIVEEHTSALNGMKDARDRLSQGHTDYTARGVEGYQTDLLANKKELEESLKSLSSSAMRQIQGLRTADIVSGDTAFLPAYDKFIASIRAGRPAFVEFRDELEKIAAANRKDLDIQRSVHALEELTSKGTAAEIQLRRDADALRGITETTRDATGHLVAFTEAMSRLQSGIPEYIGRGLSASVKLLDDYRKIDTELAKARENRETMGPDMSDLAADMRRQAARDESATTRWKDVLESRLKAGMPKYAVDNLDQTLAEKLSAAFEAAAARGAKLPVINEGYRTYADQVELYRTLGPKIAAKPGTSLHERGGAVDLGVANLSSTDEAIIREELKRRGVVNTNSEKWHFAMQSNALAEQNTAAQRVFEQGESWRKTIADFEKGTQAILDQAGATKKNSDELVRERAVLELTTALKRDNVPITAELTAQIDREAAARVRAMHAQDLWQRSIKSADEVRSTSKSILGGFISDLSRGTSGMEAFQHAVEKLRDKLTEKLSDTIIDQLLGKAGTTMSGGGGLISSFVSGIGHFFGLFAEGGSIGGGGWGIVGEKGPEIVQGPANVTPFAKVPMAAAPAPAPAANVLHMSVDVSGARGDREIQALVVSAVQAGISQFSTSGLPGRLAEIQLRGA